MPDSSPKPERLFIAPRVPLWKRLLLWVGGGYLVILAVLMFFEERLLFVPFAYPQGNWQPPIPFEDATFASVDGTKLHGWFLSHDNPQHIILFAHGNAGNVAMWAQEGDRLRTYHQAAVLVFDYRGYGKSEGSPHEAGILADTRAARAWLARRANVAETEIILAARSLGTGVVIDLAARDGARALVLVSPYTSLPEVAAVHFPWIPTRLVMRNRFHALEQIKNFKGPLIAFHGDADEVIPIEIGQRLFAAANDPKQLVVLRGAQHNSPLPREYDRSLGEFLAGLP